MKRKKIGQVRARPVAAPVALGMAVSQHLRSAP
jgi:hypothetical protein